MANMTDAEHRAWLKAWSAMPLAGSADGGAGTIGGNGASSVPAERARPKKCYYCGRADGTHIGGCDIQPTDEEFRAAVREQARRDAIRAAAKPIDLSTYSSFKVDWARIPLKPISAQPITMVPVKLKP